MSATSHTSRMQPPNEPSPPFTQFLSVLDKNRRPLGYIDVAKLKEKWEAGQADPVRSPLLQSLEVVMKLTTRLTGTDR